jgi:hypothetical protein
MIRGESHPFDFLHSRMDEKDVGVGLDKQTSKQRREHATAELARRSE